MFNLEHKKYPVSGGYEINLAFAGSGPVVVCIHGSGPGASGASNFRGNYAAFNAAGYKVILPDLIGFGASSKPEGIDYPLDLFTQTLYEALRAHGVEKAILVGNSLGGAVALQMTLDHPEFVSSLILLAPGAIEDVSVYMAMPGIQKMAQVMFASEFTIDSQRAIIAHLVHEDFAPNIPDSLVEERFAVARTQPKDVLFRMRTPTLAPRLKELDLPILVFWGQDDQFLPVKTGALFLETCRNARVINFSRTGHWVHVERETEFNAYALDFLKSLS